MTKKVTKRKSSNTNRNKIEDQIYGYLLKGSGAVVAITFAAYLLDVISFWKGTFIFMSVLGIDVVFLVLTDDDLDIGRTIGAIVGFVVGIVLIVTVSPVTTPIGIGIVMFTAWKLGWLSEDSTKSLGSGK